MASLTAAETAAAMVLVSAWRLNWTIPGTAVDWLARPLAGQKQAATNEDAQNVFQGQQYVS